jgi:hypothetical protein
MVITTLLLRTAAGQGVPGTSPEHWTTKTFLAGLAVAILVFILAFSRWNRILAGARESLVKRILIYTAEAITAVAISIVASAFDIFKRTTYTPTPDYRPDWHVVVWGCIWAVLASCYAVAKLCSITTKEGEEFKSKSLAAELIREKAATAALARQRTLYVKITSFARQLVGKKIARLCTLKAKDGITIDEFLEQLSPLRQIHLTMQLIHAFFRVANDDAPLRLALWTNDPQRQPDRLTIAYSWNGENEGCFSERSSDRMVLAHHAGIKSEVVSSYHSPAKSTKIIADCHTAPDFQFFYPEQRDKIGSMVLYKHVFSEQPNAAVVLLVTPKRNYFSDTDKDEMGKFLDEMLSRLEMESIVLDLSKKVN